MRIVIAEDQVLLREGLARLFTDRGHEIVATVGDAQALLTAVDHQQPDLAVVDIRMPPTYTDEGARAARTIKDSYPALGVLVLSQHIDARHAISLVSQPGFGYLLKDRVLDVTDFIDAAQRVAAGGSALDPHVIAALLAVRQNDPLSTLSDREREVLALMAEGLNNPAIARRLVVSERTVEGHVRHVLLKLNLAESDEGHRRVLAVLAPIFVSHPTDADPVRRSRSSSMPGGWPEIKACWCPNNFDLRRHPGGPRPAAPEGAHQLVFAKAAVAGCPPAGSRSVGPPPRCSAAAPQRTCKRCRGGLCCQRRAIGLLAAAGVRPSGRGRQRLEPWRSCGSHLSAWRRPAGAAVGCSDW